MYTQYISLRVTSTTWAAQPRWTGPGLATSGAPSTCRSSTPDTPRGGDTCRVCCLSSNILVFSFQLQSWPQYLEDPPELNRRGAAHQPTPPHLRCQHQGNKNINNIYNINIYTISTISMQCWMKFPEDPPFRISGGATVWHLDKLYLIGGYTVQYNNTIQSYNAVTIHNVG